MNGGDAEAGAALDDAFDYVLARREDAVGHITLSRSQALNALTLEMVRSIAGTLDAWSRDQRISTVVLDGAGDRGFSAGGDIRELRASALGGTGLAEAFWRAEYRLNAQIARYPKPIVAIMDGIVMGGGIGLASHASHPVVTERVQAAMPEVGIGFVPDVGATYLLSRAPGELGTHLALTGQAVGAADAVFCGLARFAVAADEVAALITALHRGTLPSSGPERGLAPGELASARGWIDECFAAESVTEILARLRGRSETAALAAADAIDSKSPTSLAVTLVALRRARELDSLEACLDQEFRMACRILRTPDFAEGIRAAIVDKDRSPRWDPPAASRPDADDVESYFTDLGDRELGLANSAPTGRPRDTHLERIR